MNYKNKETVQRLKNGEMESALANYSCQVSNYSAFWAFEIARQVLMGKGIDYQGLTEELKTNKQDPKKLLLQINKVFKHGGAFENE